VQRLAKAKFLEHCSVLMNLSNRNPYKELSKKASVRAAASIFDNWEVHRVPLVDESGEVVSILSQSRLAQLFSENIGLFPLAARTIGDLKLGFRNVYTAHKGDPAHVAFKK